MVKLQALFSDYDGTLCPLELRREDAYVTPRLRRLLTKISKNIKLGIVSTKDLDFIQERLPFTHGIAATCGLEMQVGDMIVMDERLNESNERMKKAYQEIVTKILQIKENIVIERKETTDGDLIAFCLDWRTSRNWDEARRRAAPLLNACKEKGLYVVESEISPFANVFPFQVDKGEALSKLRKQLDVTGPVMYLGDSEADDPAFQLADVSVGVKHRRVMPRLKCKYRLEFLELDSFLTNLIEANFEFNDEMLARNTSD